jgi:hypothetical protein
MITLTKFSKRTVVSDEIKSHSEQLPGMLVQVTRVVQKVKAVSTRALLSDFAWDIIFNPPYSLDVAPSDFHLFTELNQFLGGIHIGSNEEVKKIIKDWFSGLGQISMTQAYKNSSHDTTD